MAAAEGISQKIQLLVEGRDDLVFFNELLRHMGLKNVQVRDYQGKSNLGPYLKALVRTRGFQSKVKSIGIVRDADLHPAGAFQSIQSAVQAVGWAVPAQPSQIAGTTLKVGAFVLPGQNRTGELEDLLLDAVAGDPVIPCVDDYFNCVNQRQGNVPTKLSKARVHAFLASREKPNLLPGVATEAGYWRLTSHAYKPVKDFLRLL